MKITQVVLERNFHCMNDDRFIMEKISAIVEVGDTDDHHEAMNWARDEIANNFKAAYPNLDKSMNFNETINYRNDVPTVGNYINPLHKLGRPPKPIDQNFEKYTSPHINKTDSEDQKNIDQLQQLAEPKYNLLKEISNCKTLTMWTVLRKMAITPEEIKACDEKMSQLTIDNKKTEPQY